MIIITIIIVIIIIIIKIIINNNNIHTCQLAVLSGPEGGAMVSVNSQKLRAHVSGSAAWRVGRPREEFVSPVVARRHVGQQADESREGERVRTSVGAPTLLGRGCPTARTQTGEY